MDRLHSRFGPLPAEQHDYLLALGRAYRLAPFDGWATGRLFAVASEETNRLGVKLEDVLERLDGVKAVQL